MADLTQSQRVFRGILIDVASSRWPSEVQPRLLITYSEMCAEATRRGLVTKYPMLLPPFRGVGDDLGHVSTYEATLGRPLLSALVVRDSDHEPGGGFVDLAARLGRVVGTDPAAFVHAEQQAVRQFWLDPDPTRPLDAVMIKVLEQLQVMKRDIRDLKKRM